MKSLPVELPRFLSRLAGEPSISARAVAAIAFHLMAEVPSAAVLGVDIDKSAVVCARHNGVATVLGDVGKPLRPEAFDLVTSVAPYVPTRQLVLLPRDVRRYEPRLALDGGDDGLDLLRRVLVSAARLLRAGGWLLIELGGEQDEALMPALAANGFGPPRTWQGVKTATCVDSKLRRKLRRPELDRCLHVAVAKQQSSQHERPESPRR